MADTSSATLKGDIISRVTRLPKPSNATNALQPIFEAVSNAYHAIDDKYDDKAITKGRVSIAVDNHNSTEDLVVVVEDNGIGLDTKRYGAFCTTDTPWKIKRGGKGVGRLLWLDMFENIQIRQMEKKGI